MSLVTILNTPRLISQSLVAEMEDRGLEVIEAVPETDRPFVAVIGVFGTETDGWATVQEMTSLAPCSGIVVLTDHHDLRTYRRAFSLQAAVALIDTTPAAAADVIDARLRGEILAPAGVLASCLAGEPDGSLAASELAVLRHLASGLTISATAERTFYSDRHVRRLLQSILAKAGTSDRQAAIAHFQHELIEDAS